MSLLSVSPIEDDHNTLYRILDSSGLEICKDSSLASAVHTLNAGRRIPVVLCEAKLTPGTWKSVLSATLNMRHPPHLIVTSRLADEQLWAEALNLGAYDVIAKPFAPDEVKRIVEYAVFRWTSRYKPETHRPVVRKIAGATVA
jgi:DNA-binding NtrC family response regulator